jgi:hypothetical protein
VRRVSCATVLLAAIGVVIGAIVSLRVREARRDTLSPLIETARPMDEQRFWEMLEPLRSMPLAIREAQLAADLEALSEAEVSAFAQQFQRAVDRAYTWDLWGAAYVVMGGCSDDGFKEFRNWLISEGRVTYEAVLASPDRLAELAPIPVSSEPELGDWPMLPNLDLIALDRLGAFDSLDFGDTSRRLDEIQEGWDVRPAEPAGEPFEESDDALSRRFPRLWKLYGPNGERRR